jgi:hypothetical protein
MIWYLDNELSSIIIDVCKTLKFVIILSQQTDTFVVGVHGNKMQIKLFVQNFIRYFVNTFRNVVFFIKTWSWGIFFIVVK